MLPSQGSKGLQKHLANKDDISSRATQRLLQSWKATLLLIEAWF